MILHHEDHLEYHAPGHSKEIEYDTEIVTQKKLIKELADSEFPHSTQERMKKLWIKITKANAAWHDVVQKLGPPRNEIESAKEFVRHARSLLEAYRETYPAMNDVIKQFEKQLSVISKTLILNGTWLILSIENGRMIYKTLNEHIKNVIKDLDYDVIGKNSLRVSTHALPACCNRYHKRQRYQTFFF